MTGPIIGLGLLAATLVGAATLGHDIELSLIGGDSKVEHVTAITPRAEMLLLEQNSFDYAAVEPIDPLFLEENSWDYQPVANYTSAENIRLIEQNSFDYVTPTTAEEIRFQEENSWDLKAPAHPAGKAAAESAADYKFLEENSWDTDHLVYPEANGSTDF